MTYIDVTGLDTEFVELLEGGGGQNVDLPGGKRVVTAPPPAPPPAPPAPPPRRPAERVWMLVRCQVNKTILSKWIKLDVIAECFGFGWMNEETISMLLGRIL